MIGNHELMCDIVFGRASWTARFYRLRLRLLVMGGINNERAVQMFSPGEYAKAIEAGVTRSGGYLKSFLDTGINSRFFAIPTQPDISTQFVALDPPVAPPLPPSSSVSSMPIPVGPRSSQLTVSSAQLSQAPIVASVPVVSPLGVYKLKWLEWQDHHCIKPSKVC